MAEMNGYGLIAVLIQSLASLAWPAAFFASVWLFRTQLVELLPKFHLKHENWEVGFRLEKAETEAAALPVPVAPEVISTPEEKSRFEQIVKLSPAAAILEVRREIEGFLHTALSVQNLHNSSQPVTMLTATRLLRSKGLIDAHTSAILDDLRNIGNTAAHINGAEFSESDAIRFKKLADDVRSRLNVLF
jgi:hypothetical protein